MSFDLKELLRLTRNIAGNINQIAVRVNSTNNIYKEDITELQDGVEQIWQQLRSFQSKLHRLRR